MDAFVSGIRDRHQGFQAPFSERRLALIMVDTFLLALATATSILLRDWVTNSGLNIQQVFYRWYWLIPWFGIWLGSSFLNDLYDIPTSYSKYSTVSRILTTGQLSFIIYMPLSFLMLYPLSSLLVLFSLVMAIPAIIAWRLFYIKVSGLPAFRYRVLIIGTGKQAATITGLLKSKAELNFEVMGHVEDVPTRSESRIGDLNVLGDLKDLPRLISETRAHEIILATGNGINQDILQCLIECQAKGVRMIRMPDLYVRLKRQVPINEIDADWAFHAIQSQALFWRMKLGIKRMMDIVLILFGLPILGLVLPVLALAIRLDSPGPIFYRQVRSGRAGKPFYIFKFRTMVNNAEKDGKPQWAKKNDSRITRVGRFLRKARLDELPQLINILRGDMSFIGPRPERPDFVNMLREQVPFYDTRLLVKPGLTGWAQVHYDYGNSTEDALIKLQYDFFYIGHWSLWLDLYILFRTVAVVLKLKGT
ncbi:MAG: hypothetical protein AMS22_04850 [Thiotrichales bacterium SG8_50]|nr:MAG: hypothetical protein AMS22_04850 [Thiotrichales bacterium SG8_50]